MALSADEMVANQVPLSHALKTASRSLAGSLFARPRSTTMVSPERLTNMSPLTGAGKAPVSRRSMAQRRKRILPMRATMRPDPDEYV
jgi:hypothetical protein